MSSSRTLFQHAYLVNRIEDAADDWARLYGAGPFFVRRHHKTDRFMYRDTPEEADVSYAFGYLGDLMIQFIVQHDEARSIYRDMYAPGEQGFHHVAYMVDDFDAERKRLSDMGFVNACELYSDGVAAAYFDTRPANGVFTEIHGAPEHVLGRFAVWRRAHEMWDGKGSPLREAQPVRELA
jgi:catechol 2,3-dioxygenase-like lactoylglutathione lyase family enzyme